MREIEFLPEWYPAIRRRRRSVMLQAAATVVTLFLLTGYAIHDRVELQTARQSAGQIETQLILSRKPLGNLAKKLQLEQQLRTKDRILTQLGSGVDSTRLLKAMEDAMTPDMALTNFSMQMLESAHAASSANMSSQASRKSGDASDRQVKVVVDGVGPSDSEIAIFMERLQHLGCFENVTFPYLRDGRSQDGHAVREFEATFEINLKLHGEVRP